MTVQAGHAGRPVLPLPRVRQVLSHPRFARVLSLVLALVAWQLVVPVLPTELVPMPLEVGRFMLSELVGDTLTPQTVYASFGLSFLRLAAGLALAFAIGIPIGLLMGMSKRAEWFLHDFVVVGLAMPSLVWALIAAMWFGFSSTAPIVTVTLAAVTFVILNISEGVRNVPKDLLDMAQAYGVPRSRVVRQLIFPSLMPFFFAALRYGLANAWKGLVLAEVYASTAGAGWVIKFWYDAHRAQGIVGYALFFIVVALLIERGVFGRLSAYVFRWRPAIQSAPSESSVGPPSKVQGA
ncbi:MAG: ABC transporter permease subunit [Streptosporangiales bacterium]|nr:ABC transporter permease subunit [Streptosporangiales bacterium]